MLASKSGAIVIKTGFGVPFSSGIAEVVDDAAGGGHKVAKTVVRYAVLPGALIV